MSLRSKLIPWLAILPAGAGILVGAIVGLVKFLGTSPPERPSFIDDFLWNPLSSSAAATYATFIVVIFTVIIYQITRGAAQISLDERSSAAQERAEPSIPTEPETDISEQEKKKRENQQQLDRIRFAFTRNRRRMAEEIVRIQRNGFLNLSIGILFSVVALGILGYPLFVENGAPAGWVGFAERFAPRLSVGILVEFIGFFFLRLYVSGENEIHYIRNEITNFESKMIAYHIAASGKDSTALRDITKQLVRTERNFKLKKGERSLYETDHEFNDMNGLLTRIGELLRKSIPGKTG